MFYLLQSGRKISKNSSQLLSRIFKIEGYISFFYVRHHGISPVWNGTPYFKMGTHDVAVSFARFPASLTALRPSSLEARSTNTVPQSLIPRPNVPKYFIKKYKMIVFQHIWLLGGLAWKRELWRSSNGERQVRLYRGRVLLFQFNFITCSSFFAIIAARLKHFQTWKIGDHDSVSFRFKVRSNLHGDKNVETRLMVANHNIGRVGVNVLLPLEVPLDAKEGADGADQVRRHSGRLPWRLEVQQTWLEWRVWLLSLSTMTTTCVSRPTVRDEEGTREAVRAPEEEQLEIVVADTGNFGENDAGQNEEGQPLHATVKPFNHLFAAPARSVNTLKSGWPIEQPSGREQKKRNENETLTLSQWEKNVEMLQTG